MPKAERHFVEGHHYHLTHRCHNQSFLLRFAKDREVYRSMLHDNLNLFCTPLLAYCITSNHVHLLVTAKSETRISELMDALQGGFALFYNQRKKRTGAFWSGRYHATSIESGIHLWNCLIYIEMNMVRAGVVQHPGDWRWCSYSELSGKRQRYRLIDREALATACGYPVDSETFRNNLDHCIEKHIQAGTLQRQPEWTNSLAVGSESFVSQVAGSIQNRRTLYTNPIHGNPQSWVLKENTPTLS